MRRRVPVFQRPGAQSTCPELTSLHARTHAVLWHVKKPSGAATIVTIHSRCPCGHMSLLGFQWWDDADGVCAESEYDCGGFGDTCVWAADTECDVVGDFDGASIESYCEAGTVRKNVEYTPRALVRSPQCLTSVRAVSVYSSIGLHRLSERPFVLRWRSLMLPRSAQVVWEDKICRRWHHAWVGGGSARMRSNEG